MHTQRDNGYGARRRARHNGRNDSADKNLNAWHSLVAPEQATDPAEQRGKQRSGSRDRRLVELHALALRDRCAHGRGSGAYA